MTTQAGTVTETATAADTVTVTVDYAPSMTEATIATDSFPGQSNVQIGFKSRRRRSIPTQ